MDEPPTHNFVEDLYEAVAMRDSVRVAAYLTDDVEWHMDGPVGIFPFCGYWRGKAAVLDFLTRLKPSVLPTKRMALEEVVVDGNRAAAFSKVTAMHVQTGRTIVFHCAHFFSIRDGQIASMHCVADTFDAVEQLMGHRIDAYHEPGISISEDIVAI